MGPQTGGEKREHGMLIDADIVLDWADLTAEHWVRENPAANLGYGSAPRTIREAAVATIEQTAKVMADAGKRNGGGCSSDAEAIREWLGAAADAMAEPDRKTVAKRRIARFENRRGNGSGPLQRWNAGLRISTQNGGMHWMRGRSEGPCDFTVRQVDDVWTVVEHGWPADEKELHDRMVRAAATVSSHHSRALGQEPLEEETAIAMMKQDASEYCRRPEAQAPEEVPATKKKR